REFSLILQGILKPVVLYQLCRFQRYYLIKLIIILLFKFLFPVILSSGFREHFIVIGFPSTIYSMNVRICFHIILYINNGLCLRNGFKRIIKSKVYYTLFLVLCLIKRNYKRLCIIQASWHSFKRKELICKLKEIIFAIKVYLHNTMVKAYSRKL